MTTLSGLLAGTYQGYTGSQGIQGTFGITGFTGSQGTQGIQGITGNQGIQGITGTTGFTGSQGIQGIQGTQGITGSQGIQGITGAQGIQGITGPSSITATDDTTTTTLYPVMVGAAGSAQTPKVTTTKHTFNAATGVLTDGDGDVRNLPNNPQSAAYVPVVGDNGNMINITTGGVTINSGIFSAGQNLTIYNNSAANQTITQGTSVTLRLAATALTGNRTLAQRGIATVLCVAANEFVVSGAGVS